MKSGIKLRTAPACRSHARQCIFDRALGAASYRATRSAHHTVAMQAVLAGVKEVTRQAARMVKACLAVIKAGLGEEGREDEFSSAFVVGRLLSLRAI